MTEYQFELLKFQMAFDFIFLVALIMTVGLMLSLKILVELRKLNGRGK